MRNLRSASFASQSLTQALAAANRILPTSRLLLVPRWGPAGCPATSMAMQQSPSLKRFTQGVNLSGRVAVRANVDRTTFKVVGLQRPPRRLVWRCTLRPVSSESHVSRTVSHPAFPTRSQQDARHPAVGVLRGRWLARRAGVPAATLFHVRAPMPNAWGRRTPSGCRQTLSFTPAHAPLTADPLRRA